MSKLIYPEEIRKKIEENIGFCPTTIRPPSGYRVMIKMLTGEEYARLPDGKTSSIIRPDTTKSEDKFWQCVGIVISMNPACYQDERYQATGPNCQLGDWVVFPRNTANFGIYKGHDVAHSWEDHVFQVLDSPDDYKRV